MNTKIIAVLILSLSCILSGCATSTLKENETLIIIGEPGPVINSSGSGFGSPFGIFREF